MISKKFGVDFNSINGALTLPSECIGHNPSGWIIKGEIHEDYFEWVNKFEAEHHIYGKVFGDFEEEVFADSGEGFKHFYENHTPEDWDYMDI